MPSLLSLLMEGEKTRGSGLWKSVSSEVWI